MAPGDDVLTTSTPRAPTARGPAPVATFKGRDSRGYHARPPLGRRRLKDEETCEGLEKKNWAGGEREKGEGLVEYRAKTACEG